MNDESGHPPSDAPKAVPPRDASGQPLEQAARSLEQINRPFADGKTADDLLGELEAALRADRDDETMLHTQARILDALFKRFLTHDIHQRGKNVFTGEPYDRIDRGDVHLALRMQTNARTTIHALARIRNAKKAKDE
jgi:hypothetical protein